MNERILVVDDDKAVNSLIADVLRDEGYNAIVAEDESEFVSKIEEKNPDGILNSGNPYCKESERGRHESFFRYPSFPVPAAGRIDTRIF